MKRNPMEKVARPPKNHKSKGDEDLEFSSVDIQPLVNPGEYEVQFSRHEVKHMWGAKKLLMHFKIIEGGEFFGSSLLLSCQLPSDGKLKTGSKLFRLFCLANDGKRPTRSDRISTKVFRGKIFVGLVGTVETDHKQQPIPDGAQYSIIQTLTKRIY